MIDAHEYMTDDGRSRHTPALERQISVAIAALAALTAACVPRGGPPAGRQIFANRQATLVGLLPPTGDGVLRAFVMLPSANPPPPVAGSYMEPVADLYVVSADPNGGPTTEKLLVPNIDSSEELGCIFDVNIDPNAAACGAIYSRGVIVNSASGTVRADAITGEVQPITGYPVFSQDGQRFFIRGPMYGSTYLTLYDLDGNMTVLADAASPQFFGNDLLYLTSQQDLMDLPPSGVAQTLATGLIDCSTIPPPAGFPPGLSYHCTQFSGQLTQDGLVLLLSRGTSDPNVQQWSVRDPLTGTETVLPFDGSSGWISPDQPWLVHQDASSPGQFTFFDYRSGAQQEIDIPIPDEMTFVSGLVWRPGSGQAWIGTYDSLTGNATVWILEPGKPTISVPGRSLQYASPDASGRGAPFTPDGAYWFSAPPNLGTTFPLDVGLADDPTGPLIALNTAQTYFDRVMELANGRLLVATFTKSEDFQTRADTSAVDPRTGESVSLGQRGRLAGVGQTRIMGMYHWEEMRGDLTVFDVATGQPTVLAPEFTVTAFAEPQGDDHLAPGTNIVYQFQARTDSPYDGIWVATCP